VRDLTALSGVDEPTAHNIMDGRPYIRKDELFRTKSFRKRPMTGSRTR
jgi:hypothetical protein